MSDINFEIPSDSITLQTTPSTPKDSKNSFWITAEIRYAKLNGSEPVIQISVSSKIHSVGPNIIGQNNSHGDTGGTTFNLHNPPTTKILNQAEVGYSYNLRLSSHNAVWDKEAKDGILHGEITIAGDIVAFTSSKATAEFDQSKFNISIPVSKSV